MRLDQQRLERRAAPFVAAGRERAERVAVIALAARDDVAALRLALLDKVLPRHLQRRLDRLRAAADEVGVADAGRRVGHQPVGQRLGGVRGEEAGMRVSELVELRMQRGLHVGMAMAEARDRGAARSIDVAAALGVDQLDALAADRGRITGVDLPMQDAGHADPSHQKGESVYTFHP